MATQPAPTRTVRFSRHQVRSRDARRQDGALDEALTEFAGLSGQLGIEVADISGNIDALSAAVTDQAQLSVRLNATAEEIAAANHQVEAAVSQAYTATTLANEEATNARGTVGASLSQLTEFVDWVGNTGDQLAAVARALVGITQAASQSQVSRSPIVRCASD